MHRQLSLITLLLLFYSWGFSQQTTPTGVTNPCRDYWELSYQHPYLEQADSLYEVERFTDAMPLYQLAAKRFRPQENWKGLLKARNRVADCLRFTTSRDSAFSILDGNMKIIKEHLNNDQDDLAEVHFILGICFDWNNQKEKALEAYNQSLAIRIAMYGVAHIDIARCYHAIGDMYAFSDQNLNSLEYLAKADNILGTLDCKNATAIGDTYYSLASVLRGMRDLEKAEIYGFKTLSLFENNPFKKSRCFNLIANIYQNKGEFKQSLRHNSIAINLLLEHQPLSRSQRQNLANYLNSFANVYMLTQQYDSAYKYYQKSLELYNSLNNQDEVLLVYQNIGANYYWLGQHDSADYYLSKAVRMRKQNYGPKHVRTSGSLREKGTYYQQLGELDSALHYYHQAIVAAAGPEFNHYQADTNPTRESFTADDDGSLLNALYLKGSVLRKIYLRDHELEALELSLNTLLLAIEMMDVNQELYQLEGSTLFMAEDNYSLFEEALSVCYDLYVLTEDVEYLETAFSVIERSKARLLFDTFSDLQRSRMVGIPDSLLNAENDIKSRYAELYRNLENEKEQDPANIPRIRELEDQVFETTVELEKFRESLESRYPSYASAIKSEPLDLNAIRNKVSEENQILVNYFWGDSTLFSMVLQKDQISFFKQPIDTLEQLVTTYRRHLFSGPKFTNQAAWFKEYVQAAYGLYTRLFNEMTLEDKPVVIAADGPLRFIPFEGLVTKYPLTQNHDYRALEYLVRQVSTSYVYSANLWALEPEIESKTLKVLGFSHSDPDPVGKVGKNELPGTAREIELLKSQLSGSFFSGLKATKQHFFENARDYDIVHLAIHGISDSVSRLNNRLLFRDADNPDIADPLFTYELYNLQLNARLAVLSACESGIGKNFRGEGVYSMSRAFSYAGCPTTVMSLWRISDKTTPEILGQFYRNINGGMRIDQALRQAKLKYLDNHQGNMAHPNYWAAMVVHGEADGMVQPSWIRWVLPILLALLVLSLVLIKRSRKGN